MNKFEMVAAFLIFLLVGVIMGYFYNENEEEILGFMVVEKSIGENISVGCENLGLFESANCLVKNVKTFYKYTRTEGNVPLTLEEIKKNGGDCWDYTYLYSEAAKDLGFGYKYLKYPMNTKEDHIFLIIYNEEGYCLIDQLKYKCAIVK